MIRGPNINHPEDDEGSAMDEEDEGTTVDKATDDTETPGQGPGAVPEEEDPRLAGETRVGDLSAKMFWSPSPARSTALMLVLSIILGLPLFYRGGVPLYRQPLLPVAIAGIFASAVLTAYITQWYSSREGIMYPRRAFLLSFVGVGVAIPGVLFGRVIPGGSALVMVGLASPVWIRHVTLVGTSAPRHVRNLPVSLLQTLLMACATVPFIGITPFEVLVLANASIAFLAGAFLFLAIVSGPMKRVFGITPYELLVSGLEHFTTSGGLEGESFFYDISATTTVWYSYIRIRRERKPDTHLVTTTLHPGPFGLFGGSDLPTKLKAATGWRNLMVFHGPSGHDMNPPRSEDVERFGNEIRDAAKGLTVDGGASEPQISTAGDIRLQSQSIGGTAVVSATRAPEPTDDIDPATGLSVIDTVKRTTGRERGFFIDAHNSLEPGVGSIFYGDPRANAMLETAKGIALGPDGDFKAGYSERSSLEIGGDLGDMGVQALVVETGSVRTAYVLLDGNNIVIGIRDKLVSAASDLVDLIEVHTTDNHSVNRTIGGYRPVGLETPVPVLRRAVRNAVKAAIADLADAKAGGVEGTIDEFPVLGHGTTAKLTAMVNATAGTTRWAFVSSMFVAVVWSLIPIIAW